MIKYSEFRFLEFRESHFRFLEFHNFTVYDAVVATAAAAIAAAIVLELTVSTNYLDTRPSDHVFSEHSTFVLFVFDIFVGHNGQAQADHRFFFR
jgi:hypothetical protein